MQRSYVQGKIPLCTPAMRKTLLNTVFAISGVMILIFVSYIVAAWPSRPHGFNLHSNSEDGSSTHRRRMIDIVGALIPKLRGDQIGALIGGIVGVVALLVGLGILCCHLNDKREDRDRELNEIRRAAAEALNRDSAATSDSHSSHHHEISSLETDANSSVDFESKSMVSEDRPETHVPHPPVGAKPLFRSSDGSPDSRSKMPGAENISDFWDTDSLVNFLVGERRRRLAVMLQRSFPNQITINPHANNLLAVPGFGSYIGISCVTQVFWCTLGYYLYKRWTRKSKGTSRSAPLSIPLS